MRWIRGTFLTSATVAVVALLALNWRAQLQTQQKLEALTAALAPRPSEPAPAPPLVVPALTPPLAVPAPAPTLAVLVTVAVTRELDKLKPSYIIEAPDLLMIEAVVKDPKTGTIDRLPTQAIGGAFQVRLDGTVGLGLWGSVSVAGMTRDQAAAAVRDHLAKRAENVPAEKLAVVLNVSASNSKRYYVITEAPNGGEQVFVFPATGSETVLDAVKGVNGLTEVAGKGSVRISRRVPGAGQAWQQLPIDWAALTQHGVSHTNYQILSGDRIYVTRATN